jgi:PncC family amidohydrolase
MDFHDFFLQSGSTIACAESCTGGNIAHKITSNSGSSNYFLGGVVAYANEVKVNILGVSQDNLTINGAVSESVAREMAIGVQQKLQSDYAVSTTGVAGPTGGTETKPVGLVWMAVAGKRGVVAQEFHFLGDRLEIIEKSTKKALDFLVDQMKKGL